MAGLLTRLKTSTQQFFGRVTDKFKKIAVSVKRWHERYKERRRKAKIVRETRRSTPVYTPEVVDTKIKTQLADKLNQINEGHVVEHIRALPLEERKEFFEETIVPLVASTMNADIKAIGWYDCNTSTALGQYCDADQSIELNIEYLSENDEYLLRHMVNTVIHECKHALQNDAARGRNTHGYSQELIVAWYRNINDYITPEEDLEAYVKQPIEWDARCFAESVFPTDIND